MILVLVLTGFRTAVFRAVPAELKVAISVGIGLFIAFIGAVNARLVSELRYGENSHQQAAFYRDTTALPGSIAATERF